MKYLILVICVATASAACIFPSFVQNIENERDAWVYKDRNESIDAYTYNSYMVKVYGDTLKATDLTYSNAMNLDHFTWTCMEQSPEGSAKYIVRVNDTKFMCVQFMQRLESVVQIKNTDMRTSVADVSCQESRMHLDPWPLLRYRFRSSNCPQIGGFWFDFYDSNNRLMCGISQSHAERIEFECTRHEGIYIYLSRNCGHQLSGSFLAKGEKQLACRGSWTDGRFTFIALGGFKLVKNLIFRYNTKDADSNEFDMYIFRDAVADTSNQLEHSTNYIRAHLTRESMNSLCLNYWSDQACKDKDLDCRPHSRVYCPEFCGKCSTNNSHAFCNFSPTKSGASLFGEWVSSNNNHALMDPNWINFTNYESFRCNKESRFGLSLVKLSSNGCSPRYSCLKMENKSPSVITYILSYPSGWLTTGDPRDICGDKHFRYNKDVTSLKYFNLLDHYRRILINPINTKPVLCDLHYKVYTEINVTSGVSCEVTLSPENDTNFIFQYSNCTDSVIRPSVSYTCLYAEVSSDLSKYGGLWVAMKNGNPEYSFCIAVNNILVGGKQLVIALFVVPSGQCFLDRNKLNNYKYAENQTNPFEWHTEWQGYLITHFSKVEKPDDSSSTIYSNDNAGTITTSTSLTLDIKDSLALSVHTVHTSGLVVAMIVLSNAVL